MSPKPMPDFVNVRLTEAGRAFAGEHGVVRVANAHMSYLFEGDQPQRVVYRGEWTSILSAEKHEGKPLFEIVEETLAETMSAVNTQENPDAH
jgi:hypothetical protein